MTKKLLLFLTTLFCLGIVNLSAQTLFSYGNFKVDKKEFLRFYDENCFDKNKNSKESIETYLNMYALYKMKIKEAEILRLDTIPKVNSEIENLRRTLAKPYLIDNNVVDLLLKEVSMRYNEEIEIAHIQLTTWGNDTAEAYKQIHEIYNEIKNNKISFEDAVSKYSDDGYTKSQKGYIGYISALDIKYGIENAAYATKIGEISVPVKSELGYHIVKVINKRAKKGKLHIAQILVKPTNPTNPKDVEEAKALSEKILNELKAGANFEEYVAKYSADHISKDKKGIIEPFYPGTYQLQFEKVAFNLNKPGEYGEIVQTEFGFHIIRFIQREDNAPFESVKSQYSQRLKQDGRVKIAEEKLKSEKLIKMNFKENSDNYRELVTWVNADTSKVLDFTQKNYSKMDKPLFSLKGNTYKQNDFIDYIIDITGGQIYGKKDETLSQLYDLYKTNTLDNIHLDELYKNNADYRSVFDRDRNGILIFELMNQRIWQKSNDDLDGLLSYYEANKSKYTYKAGFEGYILECVSEESLKKVLPLLTDFKNIPDILFDYNETAEERVEHIRGKYEYHLMPNLKTDNIPLLQPSEMFKTPNGKSSVIIAEKTFPEGTIKPFNDSRSAVVNDYQIHLDQEWTKELMKKYPIKIDEKVLKTLY